MCEARESGGDGCREDREENKRTVERRESEEARGKRRRTGERETKGIGRRERGEPGGDEGKKGTTGPMCVMIYK